MLDARARPGRGPAAAAPRRGRGRRARRRARAGHRGPAGPRGRAAAGPLADGGPPAAGAAARVRARTARRCGRRSRRPVRSALVLPEWDRIRLLPHASPIHRFTVDRHVVETCIEASSLIRHVGRPDVLMVAALLHDIGKGGLTEHSVAGEPIARAIATRMGFDADARRRRRLAWSAGTCCSRRPRRRATRRTRPRSRCSWSACGDAETVTLLRGAHRGRRPRHRRRRRGRRGGPG